MNRDMENYENNLKDYEYERKLMSRYIIRLEFVIFPKKSGNDDGKNALKEFYEKEILKGFGPYLFKGWTKFCKLSDSKSFKALDRCEGGIVFGNRQMRYMKYNISKDNTLDFWIDVYGGVHNFDLPLLFDLTFGFEEYIKTNNPLLDIVGKVVYVPLK